MMTSRQVEGILGTPRRFAIISGSVYLRATRGVVSAGGRGSGGGFEPCCRRSQVFSVSLSRRLFRTWLSSDELLGISPEKRRGGRNADEDLERRYCGICLWAVLFSRSKGSQEPHRKEKSRPAASEPLTLVISDRGRQEKRTKQIDGPESSCMKLDGVIPRETRRSINYASEFHLWHGSQRESETSFS